MDGVPGLGAGQIEPGGSTVYEFDALPAGLHLYHCHVRPLAEHIAKGLYGAFIVDPADGREDADEMVMVMNGFDTNFDRANEVYAANTIGFAYMDRPLGSGQRARAGLPRERARVRPDQLVPPAREPVRLLPDGDGAAPSELTDTVMLCQGQRGVLEWRFAYPGKYMFHAHQSEFTELGWQGFFDVGVKAPAWVLGLVPLLLVVGGVVLFMALDAPGLGERRGPPAEELAVERTVLSPGEIAVTVRNDGPDAVSVAQVQVNDAFAQFSGRRGADRAARDRDAARAAAVGRGRGLRGRAGHLLGRDDRARDPGRGRDALRGPRASSA